MFASLYKYLKLLTASGKLAFLQKNYTHFSFSKYMKLTSNLKAIYIAFFTKLKLATFNKQEITF